FPIVFLAHGNTLANPNSFRGYNYLQAALAQAGIIAVSVRLDTTSILGDEAWAERLVRNIDHFARANSNNRGKYFGKIDFQRIGLFGHSRGGSAVRAAVPLLDAGRRVGALLLLGSDDRLPVPADVPFMAILPAAESIGTGYDPFVEYRGAPGYPDIPNAKTYDTVTPAPLKAALYVHGANHNSWNRVWSGDPEPRPPVLLSREQQEMILRSYGSAFFQAFLIDRALAGGDAAFVNQQHGAISFLTGLNVPRLFRRASPSSGQYGDIEVKPEVLHLSFKSTDRITVDDHDSTDDGFATNTLGGSNTSSGVLVNEHADFLSGYAGRTRLVEVNQQTCDPNAGPCLGFVRYELPTSSRDLTNRTGLILRAAEVVERGALSLPEQGIGFDVGLESSTGEVAWCSADRVGGLPRPYLRADRAQRYMLKTIRFRMSCFAGPAGDFLTRHRSRIAAIRIRPQAAPERKLAFDDLQLE
ncbi:MAG TPA: hypothetical protein VGF45_05795, partial [Polyangia bacterium]